MTVSLTVEATPGSRRQFTFRNAFAPGTNHRMIYFGAIHSALSLRRARLYRLRTSDKSSHPYTKKFETILTLVVDNP